ncbi:MAG: oligosaccharide flippase family protein [Janthinobacterium lividum]
MDSYQKLRGTNIIANFFNLSSIQLSNTLLLILLIPVITRKIGIEKFGIIMFASRFSQLAGVVINYGTNQSGVRDVAANMDYQKELSTVFYNTIWIRVIMSCIFCIFLVGLQIFRINYYNYLLFSIPLVLAEIVNPLFFFIGIEKLKIFNVSNLISNVITVGLIIFCIKGSEDSLWVNFILGGISFITYLGLLIYCKQAFKLSFTTPVKNDLLKIGKDNFYLTINNISVQLQQSIMIFALTKWGNASILGAYSLCDRIIGQCRNLLITISNALYPNTVMLYKKSELMWNIYRKKTKYFITGIFFTGSILLFILADYIVYFLTKEHNLIAVVFLRTMAIVPAISALNVLNVIDLLLKNKTIYIFRIAIILLIISLLTAFSLINFGQFMFIGTFTLIIETSGWLMYEYMVKTTTAQNV